MEVEILFLVRLCPLQRKEPGFKIRFRRLELNRKATVPLAPVFFQSRAREAAKFPIAHFYANLFARFYFSGEQLQLFAAEI